MNFKPNTQLVIKFMQAHPTGDYTAAMIADELGLDVKVVNGAWTQAVCKKGYGVREEAEVLNPETGRHEVVKFFRLTPEGKSLDLDNLDE